MTSLVALQLVTLVMLCLVLTKMTVTRTPHFWQQTQNYIKKLDKNAAIKVLIVGWQKWQNPVFKDFFLTKSAFLTNNIGGKILWSLSITKV